MKFMRLPNGNFVIPILVEYEGVEGHSYVEITPDDPRYDKWVPFVGTRWEIVSDSDDWLSSPSLDESRAILSSVES